MFHHRLWYWRWCRGRLWLVVWVPYRQKRDGLSSLGTNLAEMCLMFKLSAKMRWMVPYVGPTTSQTSWIVCLQSARIASWTFAVSSTVVLVDSRPEYLSSTDIRLSLKRLYHKKVLLWLMALSPKASCSIQWVSAAVFLRVKQNLMQILCSLKSVISVVKKSPDHWNITSQKMQWT